jgi:uncharacterized protein YcbX
MSNLLLLFRPPVLRVVVPRSANKRQQKKGTIERQGRFHVSRFFMIVGANSIFLTLPSHHQIT